MSPTLMMLFSFMACTFALGLFMGWAFWRFGSAQNDEVDALKSKADYWRKSFDQSRLELWNLEEKHSALLEETGTVVKTARRRTRSRSRRHSVQENPV